MVGSKSKTSLTRFENITEELKLKNGILIRLQRVPLSDEELLRSSQCDINLGSDCFFAILHNGNIIGSEGQQIAHRAMFSWVLGGQIQKDSNSSSYT
ncbi:DUF1758 domain-containing protein [Nephila pilipes]|uniref:DUF1758 domain-containing protein n=1 Tax=Nephila pilipes TaxID=299642 RepID=A0A8X6NPK1_NEPPI|nr:DUF1758 domain-containing protein [Nephila pilipes]